MSNTINAALRGKSRIVALWPHGEAGGQLGEVHKIAKRCASIVEHYDRVRLQIETNDRLSDTAKRQDMQKAAREQLKALSVVGSLLRNEAETASERRQALSAVQPYKSGDHATVAIDIALAAHLRSLDDAGRAKAIQGDPRAAEAVMRLPATLTGLTEGQLGRITTEAIARNHPTEASELGTLSDATVQAQEAITTAARLIGEDAGFERGLVASLLTGTTQEETVE
jgi:hypothetical protein